MVLFLMLLWTLFSFFAAVTVISSENDFEGISGFFILSVISLICGPFLLDSIFVGLFVLCS